MGTLITETTPLTNGGSGIHAPTSSSAASSPSTTSQLQSQQSQQSQQVQLQSQSQQRRRIRTTKRDVEYNGDRHGQVLCQMYGSVWPRVLPWCFLTLLYTYTVIYLRNHHILDLTIQDSTGYTFMSILVSFLVVTRTTITYNRFMEARMNLENLYRAAREVVQYTCVLTFQSTGQEAQKWRQAVAYRTIVCLRMAVSAVEFNSQGISAWQIMPNQDELEYDGDDDDGDGEQQQRQVAGSNGIGNCHSSMQDDSCRHSSSDQRKAPHEQFLDQLAHGPRTVRDDNFRAPILWAYNLREKIMEPRIKHTILDSPMHVNEEVRILAMVSELGDAYHSLKKLITTPFPFPLVQMTRTFLFFWVFSLPSVLIAQNDQVYEVLIIMFFCTYGFFGLEYVNMELDDPYGEDPNDFAVQRWAESAFEDIYIAIYKTDGYESAVRLRSRITARIAKGYELDNYQNDILQDDFWLNTSQQLTEPPV